MSKRNRTLELLRGLLAERQQFEQWLAALAKKRADTPDQVYTRVHQDYQSRLDGVLDRLHSHTQDLQSSMSELATQLAEVTGREDTRREAQQEAELRAAVGEYSAEKWTEMSREAESELKKLSQERNGIESQLAELSEILEVTEGRTPVPVQPGEVPAAPEAPVVEEVRESTPAPPPVEAPVTQSADIADTSEPVKFPNWSESDKSQAESTSATQAKSKTAPVRPESEKTLKCHECEALNFPTEWYCETCGAELATL